MRFRMHGAWLFWNLQSLCFSSCEISYRTSAIISSGLRESSLWWGLYIPGLDYNIAEMRDCKEAFESLYFFLCQNASAVQRCPFNPSNSILTSTHQQTKDHHLTSPQSQQSGSQYYHPTSWSQLYLPPLFLVAPQPHPSPSPWILQLRPPQWLSSPPRSGTRTQWQSLVWLQSPLWRTRAIGAGESAVDFEVRMWRAAFGMRGGIVVVWKERWALRLKLGCTALRVTWAVLADIGFNSMWMEILLWGGVLQIWRWCEVRRATNAIWYVSRQSSLSVMWLDGLNEGRTCTDVQMECKWRSWGRKIFSIREVCVVVELAFTRCRLNSPLDARFCSTAATARPCHLRQVHLEVIEYVVICHI